MNKFVVLISGYGSNLEAMCNSGLAPNIAAVISNKKDVRGLTIATKHNIPTCVIEHTSFKSRKEFDQALKEQIDTYAPMFVVLAGFMRILTKEFVDHYENRLINIHPSILPAFIGPTAQHDALEKKVKVTGATVHFVTVALDSGPTIAQGIVPLKHDDTLETIKARIRELEHVIYPFVIKKYLANQISIGADNAVIVKLDANDANLTGKFLHHIFY